MKPDHADAMIRAALKEADAKGRLGRVADASGIAGGEAELRKIMLSTGPLQIMDRGMLGIHLFEVFGDSTFKYIAYTD